ncbi:flagellar basal body rod protein FlgB [Priestia aryabhattai]|uniref:Flagellar basal body rod protein FlgB n=1 Tax=Priestia aryabhattai TaxID=412384 RepID=A0AAX6NE55_PRIAR|nr:flagellar basal body rod protein FlgB [Priestia aryabhattai]MDU9693774.1 flagellar basal body rod protein FlgB [Priestia aryabhattai]
MFGDFIPYVNDVMDYSSVNRKVIADNISNYNTPGYKAKTLRFEQIVNSESGIPLNTTNEKHITNHSSLLSLPAYKEVETSDGSSRVDGNNVNQTVEMINMLKNNSMFTNSVNAINKEFSLIKIAIGR